MKKLMSCICIAILLACSLVVHGTEAPEQNVISGESSEFGNPEQEDVISECFVSAYGAQGATSLIYTFFDSKKFPANVSGVRLLNDEALGSFQDRIDEFQELQSYPEYVRSSGLTVRYMFLIDCSTSMPVYEHDVSTIIRSLIEKNEKQDVDSSYTIANCGTKMDIIGQPDQTDLSSIMSLLDGMEYDHHGTDFYTGAINALKYLKSQPVRTGTLTNLVLITDGIPYMEDDDEEKLLAQKLAAKIEETPEIIVHTICLENWEGNAEECFGRGTGCHEVLELGREELVDNVQNPPEPTQEERRKDSISGEGISDFVNGIQLCTFETEMKGGDTTDLQIEYLREIPDTTTNLTNLIMGKTNLLKNIKVMTITAEGGISVEDKEEPETSDNDGSNPNEADSQLQEADLTSIENVAAGNSVENEAAGSTGEAERKNPLVFAIVGFIIGAILLGSVFSLMTRKKKKANEKETTNTVSDAAANIKSGKSVPSEPVIPIKADKSAAPAPSPIPGPDEGRIPVSIEVFKGNCVNKNNKFYLGHELIIGSDPEQCHIVFDQNDVAPRHTRIFRNDTMLFIEDLGSPTGTFLGGIRLQSVNRLRSGDEIRIGNAGFVPWF